MVKGAEIIPVKGYERAKEAGNGDYAGRPGDNVRKGPSEKVVANTKKPRS